MKEDVEKLPSKEEVIVWVELTQTQKVYYKALYSRQVRADQCYFSIFPEKSIRSAINTNQGCTARHAPQLNNTLNQRHPSSGRASPKAAEALGLTILILADNYTECLM